MGKGRAPCCDKSQVKRGPWSPEEDIKLITFIQRHGHENWRALPKQAGLLRCGKSCRLRWINYLRPDVKRGHFTRDEEETILRLHETFGNKWSKIASHLPGRTDNEIKNVWNTHLKKRVAVRKSSESSIDESKEESTITSSSSSSSDTVNSSGTPATSNSAANELNEQACPVTMTEAMEQDSEKQVSNELNGVTEDLKGSSTSFSFESNISGQIAAYKPEEPIASPSNYPGPYDVDNALLEVSKPGSLLELSPVEIDYEFWNMLDNLGSDQSSEVQLDELEAGKFSEIAEKSIQYDETRNWLQYLENELELGGTKDESQNDAAEPAMDPQTFDFQTLTKPDSDADMDFIQSWLSCPHNPGL